MRLPIPPRVLALLEECGIHLTPRQQDQLEAHAALVREWNGFVSLVSQGDLGHLTERHLVDALSLAPYLAKLQCAQACWVDIGAGGGFPAIPLKVLFPHIPLHCIERSAKKVGFLRQALGRLDLSSMEIHHGEFPRTLPHGAVRIFTARAVERSTAIHKAMAACLREQEACWNEMPTPGENNTPGCVFLCQSGAPDQSLAMFHVEHIQDAWTQEGLRRGNLHWVSTGPRP